MADSSSQSSISAANGNTCSCHGNTCSYPGNTCSCHGIHTIDVNGVPVTFDISFIDNVIRDRGDDYLGSGSFAKVYRYKCPRTDICIALKHLTSVKPSVCGQLCDKFQREIDVHKELSHDNILKFIGSIRDGNIVLLVVEYAEKRSIEDLTYSGHFDRSKILDNTVQILSGLEYLHSFTDKEGHLRPIVHRDLRCANILITGNDIVKIADFGICKQLKKLAEASGNHSRIGNAFWSAPELIDRKRGRSAYLTLVDIWSLGVVIMEMYYYGAHRVPYIRHYRNRELQYGFKLGQGMVPKTPQLAPTEIKRLLDRCFEYNLERRPSATELLLLISRFEQGKIDKLEITEDIVPPVYNESGYSTLWKSNDDNSTPTPPNVNDTTPRNTTGVDADTYVLIDQDNQSQEEDEDSKYLTMKFERRLELRQEHIRDGTMSKYKTAISQIPYMSKGTEGFILEDRYHKDHSYVVKKGGTEEEVFRVTFDEAGKCLTVKQRDTTIYSIDAEHERDGHLGSAGEGSFARLKIDSPMHIRDRKRRLKLKSINTEGSHKLSIMSIPSLKFNDLSLVVKKNKQPGGMFNRGQHPPEYRYTIRFKHDKAEIAKFNMRVEECKCDIVAQPQTDTALITAVVAFYYKYKSSTEQGGLKGMFMRTWRIGSRYNALT